MGYLRLLLEKTEYRTDDSFKKAFLKGVAEGALDGLVIVGSVHVIANIIDMVKK